jgi:hypothetical protein
MAHVARGALAYFAMVFAVGSLLGTVRVLWLVPRFGPRAAELLELPLMLVASVMAARWAIRRFTIAAPASGRLAMGLLALGLLLAAEVGLAAALRDASPVEAFVNRDPVSGTAYYLSLAVFALLPLLVHRSGTLRSGIRTAAKRGQRS